MTDDDLQKIRDHVRDTTKQGFNITVERDSEKSFQVTYPAGTSTKTRSVPWINLQNAVTTLDMHTLQEIARRPPCLLDQVGADRSERFFHTHVDLDARVREPVEFDGSVRKL
jgi:hypothetical protein